MAHHFRPNAGHPQVTQSKNRHQARFDIGSDADDSTLELVDAETAQRICVYGIGRTTCLSLEADLSTIARSPPWRVRHAHVHYGFGHPRQVTGLTPGVDYTVWVSTR